MYERSQGRTMVRRHGQPESVRTLHDGRCPAALIALPPIQMRGGVYPCDAGDSRGRPSTATADQVCA